MLSVLTTIGLIIIGVLLFELIILFHEGGHFIAAKRSGVQVNEFAIGMGPKIFGFKKGETQYSLRLLPIGGYCAMEAEDDESDNPRAFTNAKIWKRMIIIVAGAFMNIVLGLLMSFALVVQEPYYASTTVAQFDSRSFSSNCGLQAGDEIVRLNNYGIGAYQDLTFAFATMKCRDVDGTTVAVYKEDCVNELALALYGEVSENKESYSDKTLSECDTLLGEGVSKINVSETKKEAKGIYEEYFKKLFDTLGVKKYKITEIKEQKTRKRFQSDMDVIRNGERITLKDVQFFTYTTADSDEPKVALDFYVDRLDKNFGTVMSQTWSKTVSTVRMVWSSLVGLVTGQFSYNDISGPVGAGQAVTQAASIGLETGFADAVNNILFMMMLITVNLGIFNMLPFPALDGGRFLFLLIEAVFRKPIPRKVEKIVNTAGLVILLTFMLLITVKDVFKIFGG